MGQTMRDESNNTNTLADYSAAVREFSALAGPILPALERYPVSMIVADARLPDNPIIFANEAFRHLTGYEPQEVLGLNCRFLQGRDTDPETVAKIAAALREGREIETDILNYRKDGSAYWNTVSIFPVLVDAKAAFFVSTQISIAAGSRENSTDAALRASQRKLDEVNERLRLTLSLTGAAAAWEWHIGENRIVGDSRFAALYGISTEEAARGVSPELFFSIVHPEDQTRVRLAIGGILRGAEVFSKEFRIMLAPHSVRWVQARGRCQYDDEDRPIRFSGVLVDITERKLAEERLRIAQTAGGIGTFEYVDGFGTATVSAQFCSLLGLHPAHDLPVHTINAVVHPGERPLIGVSMRHADGGEVNSELRIIRPDTGEVRWLAKRGECSRDAETAGVRFSGVIYDITNSKRTEESLRTLNETLESRVEQRTRERDGIWQLSKDLLAIADTNGVWQSVNPAWTRVLGWSADEIVGRTSEWLQHPDDRETNRAPFNADSVAGFIFNNRLRTRGGDYRSLSWTAVPQAGLFYCVARDVTEQLQQEETLARAEDQLRQAHKMEAVGQLTGGIAHDFNNMLTGVIASLGLIQRRLKAGRTDGVDDFIEAGLNSAHRAATLTHSLLAFARRQSLDVKAQDINALVAGIQEIVRRPLGENITVEFILTDEPWMALTDANQFENALLNLALNSRDAMPDGGRLTIRTTNEHLEASSTVQGDQMPAGDYVVVSVTDTGTGMSPDIIAKAFEPFFTTKPIGKGTGLGLSMIYGFVKQSGGHIRISSQVGRGTTAKIYLRRALHSELQAAAPGETQPPLGRGERVLVVEDDASVRFTVTELLKELGYSYIEAKDAASAIPHLESDQPIDLLVTDVGLPNMNGRELAEIGRQHRADLRVLFITGYTEKARVRSGFLGPGMQMMSKPFTVEALGAKIRELLEN